jgi:hypothetical protein
MSDDAATLIYSGTAEWNAWLNRYQTTWPKQHLAMMNAMAAVTQRRARWLLALLLEIFSSDIPSEDVTIDQSEQRTTVLIRGSVQREFTMRAMFAVPSPMPPVTPAAAPHLRRVGGVDGRDHAFDGLFDAVRPAPPAVLKLDPETAAIREGARTLRMTERQARDDAEFETTRQRRARAAVEEATLAAALEAAKGNLVPDVEASELLDTILIDDPEESYEQELIGAGPAMKTPKKNVPQRRRVIAVRDDVVGKMAKRGQLHEVKPPAQLAELCRRRDGLEAALDALPAIDKLTAPGERKRVERRARQIEIELRGVIDEIAAIQNEANARAEEEKQMHLNAARFYEKLYLAVEIGGARAIDPFREVVDGGRFITPDTDIRMASARRLAKIDAALGSDAVNLVRAVLVQKWEIGQVADAQGNDTVRHQRHLRRRLRDSLDEIARFMPETPRPAGFRSAQDVYATLAMVASNVNAHGVLVAAIEAARKP